MLISLSTITPSTHCIEKLDEKPPIEMEQKTENLHVSSREITVVGDTIFTCLENILINMKSFLDTGECIRVSLARQAIPLLLLS